MCFVAAFCLLGVLLSCSENEEEQQLLNSIEQTWQQCETSLPDARMRAGRLRDSVRLSSEYVRQKYNLLTIRLRDKYDVVSSSPDSAMQALTYFAKRKDAIDKERAYYYMGSAYRDLKDYPRAMSHFLTAVDIAKHSKAADTLIWQNSLSQLRNLYMLGLNYEEELNVALQAVELARQSGKNPGCYLTDVASAYKHMNDTVHCLLYCDQAYEAIQEECFPTKYGKDLSYLLAIYSNYQRYEKVDTLLQHLSQLPKDRRPHNYELCLAKFHENAGHTDSAIAHYRSYYDNVKEIVGRYEASAGLQHCYLRKGDLRQAAEWGCHLYETNDSIIAQRAFEETQRARNTYIYYRDKEKEHAIMLRNETLARRNGRIIFASVVTGLALLSIVLGLVAFYNFRKKKFMEEIIGKDRMIQSAQKELINRQEKLDQKQQEIEKLGCQLEDAEQTIAASKMQLENALKELEQRTLVNKELTRIALMNNATETAESVIEHFRQVASGRSKLKEESWKELMTSIETLYPGFLEKIQIRLKKQLREPLLHTICLMKIGMKPVQITKVMDAKIQTVWNRVKRAEEICGNMLASG